VKKNAGGDEVFSSGVKYKGKAQWGGSGKTQSALDRKWDVAAAFLRA